MEQNDNFIEKLKQNQQNQSDKQDDNDNEDWANDPNQKFFNLNDIKPFDLKAQWLGNTNEVIKKFQQKYTQVKTQNQNLKNGMKNFQENYKRYKIDSLKKIDLKFDKKEIYLQFIKKSRRPIQKLHPGLIMKIGSYVTSNVFLFLVKIRRVSKVYNFIYKTQDLQKYLSKRDLGQVKSLKQLQKFCQRWINFQKTFKYYKQILYTEQLPPNSFKQDLQEAVEFINDVHRQVFKVKSTKIKYFIRVNNFMKKNRIVIALSSLSLANMVLIRKQSIIAFSNYLGYNESQRKKQEITKTKYSKVIQIVQNEDYRDSLILNTKISNYLQDERKYIFGLLITNIKPNQSEHFLQEASYYDILIAHKHNDSKNRFRRLAELKMNQQNHLEFDAEQEAFTIKYITDKPQVSNVSLLNNIQHEVIIMQGNLMNCILANNKFESCFVYNSEYYYMIIVKRGKLLKQQQNENYQNEKIDEIDSGEDA